MQQRPFDDRARTVLSPQRILAGLILIVIGLVANPWVLGLVLFKGGTIAQPRIVAMISAVNVLLVLAGVMVAIGGRSKSLAIAAIVGAMIGAVGPAEYHVYEHDVARVDASREFARRSESRQTILARAVALDRDPIVMFGTESSAILPGLHDATQTLRVKVPSNGVLDTAVAIDPLVRLFFRGMMTFEISARTQDPGDTKLFSSSWSLTTPREPSPFQWVPIHVDLSRWAGQTIDLTFRRTYSGDDAWRGRHIYDLEPSDLAVWRKPVVRPRHIQGKKNVVLISIDTLRADHLHFMGYRRDTSPNLDKLAADSVVFDECFSQAPWTTPSHFSILTGTYPATNGTDHPLNLYDPQNPLMLERSPRHWNPKIPMLAMILRNQGYETAAFTGMGPISASFGFYRGFDSYNETAGSGMKDGGRVTEFGMSDARRIATKAEEWVRANRDRTFFLFVHTFEAHWPYTHDYFVNKEHIAAGDEMATTVARYDGDIRFADQQFGALLEFLRKQGLMKNTLIVFVSDHGEELTEGAAHGYGLHVGHGHNLFDELLHIPLVFHGLSSATKPVHIKSQVRSIDILPTILADLGVPKPDTIEGASLLPMIHGDEAADRPAYSEATTYGPERESLRANGFKYVHRIGYGTLAAPCCVNFPLTPLNELYDLRKDPGELHDIAGSRPDVLARMEALMNAIRPRPRPTTGQGESSSPSVPVSHEVIQSLRSLGYIH